MSDPIEEVTELITEPIEEVNATTIDACSALGNDETRDRFEEEPAKPKRVMSDKQKECLKLAREKAFLYRRQLKEEKEKLGDVKPTKTKKLNKSQIKILELQKRNEEKEEVKEEIKEIKEVKEIKEEIKEIKEIKEVKEEDAIGSSSIKKEIKPIEEVKQYKYVKDENGNLYLR
jgi:hypothetical protein